MARKRVRDFRRFSLTAKTAKFLEASLVDKTHEAHQRMCVHKKKVKWPVEAEDCIHRISRSMDVAELFARGLKIGEKRATLDLQCPYSLDDPQDRIQVYEVMAGRMRDFAKGEKRQLADAIHRISKEIEAYAHRNAMQVIAEAAL